MLRLDGFHPAGGSGGGRLFLLHRRFLHSGVTSLGRNVIQAEVVIDALDLGGVICKHHHLDALRLLPVPNGDVQQPVLLGFPGKFLHITHRHLKEFERALFFEHPYQPRLTTGFLLIL